MRVTRLIVATIGLGMAACASEPAEEKATPSESSVLTEERARATVGRWLTQEGLELMQWKGLIKESDNEMIARISIKPVEFTSSDPQIMFRFQRTADDSWALTRVGLGSMGSFADGFVRRHMSALGDTYQKVP